MFGIDYFNNNQNFCASSQFIEDDCIIEKFII